MDLSVIIVSYNVKYFLEQCLVSVLKAAEGIDCEIFVIDNNSDDESCSMVKNRYPGINLIINHTNRGFSAANNQAIKAAKGKYILILNPDTIVEEDTFSKCIDFMEIHPDAGALGVRMIDGKGRFLPESKRGIPYPATAFFKMTGLSYLFPKSILFNKYQLGYLDEMETNKADVISGAFMFLRKKAVHKTGLLDEDYFMYGEDIDYSYRLLKAGFSNYYFPGTTITHFKGQSTSKTDIKVTLTFYRAMLIFVHKHLKDGNSNILVLLIKVAIFFRASLSVIKRFIISNINPKTGRKRT